MTSVLNTELNLSSISVQSFLDDQDLQKRTLQGCTLFFWDYSCDGWSADMEMNCDKIRDEFNLEQFKSYDNAWHTYTFYTLLEKK